MLLTQACIPFTLIAQDADERACMTSGTIEQIVLRIAQSKMKHAEIPEGNKEGQQCYVLTADTMVQDVYGTIHGKPTNRADAITKLKIARLDNYLATAFCIQRLVWEADVWVLEACIEQVVTARYQFNVPDAWIDYYLDTTLGIQCAGAAAVEGFGAQFLRAVKGSHSCIIGLPLYEVREGLERLGFFIGG
jgi:predicted house-cleaning NTP pyrophosphatase (Maf/HAM1 superfamily)